MYNDPKAYISKDYISKISTNMSQSAFIGNYLCIVGVIIYRINISTLN